MLMASVHHKECVKKVLMWRTGANSTESPWKKQYHSQLWYSQWWGQPFRDWTKTNAQIECNSLEPATVYWKAYWNHLLIPSSYQNTVLDRKWKKLMKKSALSEGSVLLLRSVVLHFTLFREFGLDYDSPVLPKTQLVASIKNLNSSSLFWFYRRPNPGSQTSLRKALSLPCRVRKRIGTPDTRPIDIWRMRGRADTASYSSFNLPCSWLPLWQPFSKTR